MAKLTIALGVILIALGLAGYFGAGRASLTALIPAFFGLPLLLLGIAALDDRWRKHAMHGALLLALLGAAGSARGLTKLPALLSGDAVERPAAVMAQSAMAILCFVFVVLGILSFIKARRRSGV